MIRFSLAFTRAVRAAALAALLPVAGAHAQGAPRRAPSDGAPADRAATPVADAAASLLGMTLTVSGNERDTLGLLVAVVTPGGPADRAGVEEGSRLAELNGTALRVASANAGQRGAGDVVQRRLARLLGDVQAGDEVSLRTYRGGRYRALTLRAGRDGGSADAAYAAPVAAPPAAPTPRQAAAVAPPASAVTLASVLSAMGELESQLNQLSLEGEPTALGDSLVQAEQELGDLRLRLRAAEARQRRRPSRAPADDESDARREPARAAADLAGLRLGPVDEDLVAYYGEGSDRGQLVLDADESWAPIRTGDVILTVNGAPAEERRLAAAAASGRPVRVELLRRRRALTVVMQPRE